MKRQDEVFLTEGDNWFDRNREHLGIEGSDLLFAAVKDLGVTPRRVLDVGCSNGHRVQRFVDAFSSEGFGVDPSQKAITDGTKRYPKLKLRRGVSHDLRIFSDGFFDLVLVSFVFHWVDRRRLFLTAAEIDRVLAQNGSLIIQDFEPPSSYRSSYHHLPKGDVYTYKQSYWKFFTESGLYRLAAFREFEHNPSSGYDPKNACSLAVLIKGGDTMYPEW